MIYKFTSKAAGDVIMLGPDGDRMLRLMGREPAPKGIIEPKAMAAAIASLEAAVHSEESASAPDDDTPVAISLRQRVWPMVEMLKRALPEEQPVVWGV